MADGFVRLAVATVLAFSGIVAIRSARGPRVWLAVRVVAALALWAGAILLVRSAVPFANNDAMPSLSIVATAVFIAALAADELVGSDVRRLLRF